MCSEDTQGQQLPGALLERQDLGPHPGPMNENLPLNKTAKCFACTLNVPGHDLSTIGVGYNNLPSRRLGLLTCKMGIMGSSSLICKAPVTV